MGEYRVIIELYNVASQIFKVLKLDINKLPMFFDLLFRWLLYSPNWEISGWWPGEVLFQVVMPPLVSVQGLGFWWTMAAGFVVAKSRTRS